MWLLKSPQRCEHGYVSLYEGKLIFTKEISFSIVGGGGGKVSVSLPITAEAKGLKPLEWKFVKRVWTKYSIRIVEKGC